MLTKKTKLKQLDDTSLDTPKLLHAAKNSSCDMI